MSFWPPKTDSGQQLPFKYPFSMAHTIRSTGGWSRSVTAQDLPISRVDAIQERHIPGGISDMHWHSISEWHYLIYGKVRITAVGPGGRAFVDDVYAGDIWFYPRGVPHSNQAIGDEDSLWVSAFNGRFTEFSLRDWLNRTPKDVLSKNFQTPESTFANVPRNMGIFAGQMPLPLQEERLQASMITGNVPQPYSFHTKRMRPNVTRTSGYVYVIDRNNFPVTEMASAIVTLKPGGMREMHWHPDADEWQYYVRGKARMTVLDANGSARTTDFRASDIGYVQQSHPHYIENTCEEDLVYLEVFPTPYYQDISLALWLAHTPPLMVDQHIRTGQNFINNINKTEATLVPW